MNARLPRFYLVRHGETAWSASGQHTGRTDVPLTAQGERDAQRLASRFKGLAFAGVLSSPLQRARRTAELAGFGHGPLRIDDDLVEWNYGDYEGRRTVDIRRERPGWRLFEHGCPGGETAEAVGARADRVIRRIRAMPGDVLVFAHRDILRVLAARWLGLSATQGSLFQLAPTSLGVLGYDHDPEEPVIHLWNDVELRSTISPASQR